MKIQMKILVLSVIVLAAASCSSGGSKTEASDAREVKSSGYDQMYVTNTDESMIMWEGYKPTGKHDGTIRITDGSLQVTNGNLTGGEFTVDMNSIVVLDLTDPEKNAQLKGHLESADFFEIETYPTAKFVITGAEAIDGTQIDKSKEKGDIVPTHALTGNLTMKDVTKSITFNAKVNLSEEKISAETNQFFIDRSQWNVRYGSKSFFDDLKDNFINDEMGLTIKMVANANDKMASK